MSRFKIGDVVYVEQSGGKAVKVKLFRHKDRIPMWVWVNLDAERLTDDVISSRYKLEDFIPEVATNASTVIHRNDIFAECCNTLQQLYNEYEKENTIWDPRSRVYGDSIIVDTDNLGIIKLINIRTSETFYMREKDLFSNPRRKAQVYYYFVDGENEAKVPYTEDDEGDEEDDD